MWSIWVFTPPRFCKFFDNLHLHKATNWRQRRRSASPSPTNQSRNYYLAPILITPQHQKIPSLRHSRWRCMWICSKHACNANTKTQHPRASSLDLQSNHHGISQATFPRIPRSHILTYEGSIATGCCKAFVIDIRDDSTCNTCPHIHIHDKLHHAFAGPLGIKDFDITNAQLKKIDDGNHSVFIKRGDYCWDGQRDEDYPTFQIGTVIAG